MGDDEIRLNLANDIHDLVASLAVVGVDIKVMEATPDYREACKLACASCLLAADLTQFLGHDLHVTHVSVGQMAGKNLVAALCAFDQGSGARDLNIVGMGSDS